MKSFENQSKQPANVLIQIKMYQCMLLDNSHKTHYTWNNNPMRMAEVVTLSITPYINTQSPHGQITWSEKRENRPNTQRQQREKNL